MLFHFARHFDNLHKLILSGTVFQNWTFATLPKLMSKHGQVDIETICAFAHIKVSYKILGLGRAQFDLIFDYKPIYGLMGL